MSEKLVFVSYSRKDRAFLDDELMPFLRNLLLNEQIELWNDQLIGVGDDWYAEIADRLDRAKVAILLVTPEFLGSRFCLHEEIPILLQRARRGELKVLPLFAEPCFFENEPWLSRLQMWPGPEKAVSQHDAPTRKSLLSKFAKDVRDAVEASTTRDQSASRFDLPHPTHDLHRMPQTGSLLFGRRDEIRLLDEAWNGGKTNIVAFTAGGGVGKSTLARVWTEMLAEDGWRGADRAYAWSFYSQGTGRMTDAETLSPGGPATGAAYHRGGAEKPMAPRHRPRPPQPRPRPSGHHSLGSRRRGAAPPSGRGLPARFGAGFCLHEEVSVLLQRARR